MHISSLLLGEATAQVIANAFFGVCRRRGELDRDENAVSRVLRKTVAETIQTRNDIAHGDWQIGNVRVGRSGDVTPLPPRLVRILPTRTEGPFRTVDLSVGEIDKLADKIEYLHVLIQDFGHLALKLPVFNFTSGTGSVVSTGEFRVRDVLTATAGRQNSAAQVLRNGPRAEEVFAGVDSRAAYEQQRTTTQQNRSTAD